MPRVLNTDHVLEYPAEKFWKLRMDTGFDEYIAECDKQVGAWRSGRCTRGAESLRGAVQPPPRPPQPPC